MTPSPSLWVLLAAGCTQQPAPPDGKPTVDSVPVSDSATDSGTTVPVEDDADGDGTPRWDDCDDNDASIHPAAAEVPGDGVDQDCDCQDRETLRATDADVVWQGDVPYDHAGGSLLEVVRDGSGPIGLMMGADQSPPGEDAGFGRVAYWALDAAVAILDGSAPKTGPFTEAMGETGAAGPLGVDGEALLVVGRGYSDDAEGTASDPQNGNGNVDFYQVPAPGSIVPLDGVYARLTGPYGAKCGSSIVVMDADGDGVEDVMFACNGSAIRGVYILLGPVGPGTHSLGEAAWWIAETPNPDTDDAILGTYGQVIELSDAPNSGAPLVAIRAYVEKYPLFLAGLDAFRTGTPITTIPTRIDSPDGEVLIPRTANDPNNDGVPDLLVGTPSSGGRSGGLAVVHGPVDGAVDIRFVTPAYVGTCAYDWFGASSVVGDFNGDGYPDLAVGAPADFYFSAPRVGKVFVFGGPGWDRASRPPESADQILAGDLAWDSFGANLAAADIDQDGFDDLFVSAPLDSRDVWEAGRVYRFRGSPEGLTGAPAP